jgi:hypothetical protein
MSADGKRMVAAEGPNLAVPGLVGAIYTSTDFGSTWVSNAVPVTNWNCVASSADGRKLVAVVNGDGIYTWQTTPVPVLNIIPSGNNLLLSWTVPSMTFVLQENPDLTTTGWSDVGTSPALSYTNLQFQVTLATPAGTRFYRLVLR